MWRSGLQVSSKFIKTRSIIGTLKPHASCFTVLQTNLLQRQPSRQASQAGYYVSQDFPPIYATQQVLEAIHTWTHLPWWATIIGVTVVLRTCITLPLAIRQNKLVAKIELLQPTLQMMTEALKHREAVECKRAGKTVEEFEKRFKKKQRRMMYELYQGEGCNPIKMFLLPWIQLPLWILISLSLRSMTGTSYSQRNSGDLPVLCPEMASEGALWFPDLLVPDPTIMIPLAVGICNLTNIEMHALRRQQPSRFQRVMTNTLRLLSVFMVMFASQVPTAMSLYWAVSAGFGVCQNVCLKLPTVRRQLGIPKTPSESKTPFRDLRNIAQAKMDTFLQKQRQDPWRKGK
ncbi:cytochrome c oxidase assembly protein COX18, mitochondrial isoform X2 [Nematostella vectensis]|uniref:cytochrome c oxidase assembly protein COX18, mitochondrial isoform X2 n=1 Tax=Nematostella vectensis TaxID=45351 RepID=UPI001390001B|nr:cytochrome c oxidase assembly protein COX18, mitochondrial isoform X2 [Nematostella vectensis]